MIYNKQQTSDFLSIARELEPTGSISMDKSIKFKFKSFDKQYESYSGSQTTLSYFLKVSVGKQYGGAQTKVLQFVVKEPVETPLESDNPPLKMEVGIEDCLHIKYEFNKSRYHLNDCIFGQVDFLLVKVHIKYMEINIFKREIVGTGQNKKTHSEKVAVYEVMDGSPNKNETVPVRLYLSGFDLTPTYENISNKFSVRYYISLVLVDVDDRRYFK